MAAKPLTSGTEGCSNCGSTKGLGESGVAVAAEVAGSGEDHQAGYAVAVTPDGQYVAAVERISCFHITYRPGSW